MKLRETDVAIDESFLIEQLIKMREMTERMSEARTCTAELSEQLARERDLMHRNPLFAVRDFRTEQSYDPRETPRHEGAAQRPSTGRRRRS
jgi:hypothetical protein